MRILKDEEVYANRWLKVRERSLESSRDPYYIVDSADYVTIIAVTPDAHLLLVTQYRAAVDGETLEFISGHIEDGETPALAAEREVIEETGFEVSSMEFLGSLYPNPSRNLHRQFCFFARLKSSSAVTEAEPGLGLTRVAVKGCINMLLNHKQFLHSSDHAIMLIANARGYLKVEG